jgi:chromate transporter
VPIVDSLLGEELPEHVRPNVLRALQVLAVWFALWLIPVAALLWAFGSGNVFSQIAVFFSKMAMVTFGGAYAVLAYVAQRAVEHYAWLKPGEMLDGLGMAETTPGPLIMVLQFVGFMAASRDPGGLPPMLARPLVTDRDNPIFQYAAFNHFRIRRMMRGSPTRCSTKRTSQL